MVNKLVDWLLIDIESTRFSTDYPMNQSTYIYNIYIMGLNRGIFHGSTQVWTDAQYGDGSQINYGIVKY